MASMRNVRVALSVATLAFGAISTGAVGVATATAAGKPHLVVKPASGLKNGSVLKVTGSGFKPKDQLIIVECLRTSTGQAGCKVDITKLVTVIVSAKGTVPPTTFKVSTGTIGGGTCGTKATNIAKCEVSAGNASGGDTASAPIVFALPKG